MTLNLDSVVCPGCGEKLTKRNTGCPDCGYEDGEHGRILTLAELAALPSYPAQGAAKFNEVSPKFLRALIEAARATA